MVWFGLVWLGCLPAKQPLSLRFRHQVITFDANGYENVYENDEEENDGGAGGVKRDQEKGAERLSFDYSRIKDEARSAIKDEALHVSLRVDVVHLVRAAKRRASNAGGTVVQYYDSNSTWLKPLLRCTMIALVLIGIVLLLVLTQSNSQA